MIMLPLHGQDTAAVKLCHWAGWTFYYSSKGDVFVKQAKLDLPSSLVKYLVYLFLFNSCNKIIFVKILILALFFNHFVLIRISLNSGMLY